MEQPNPPHKAPAPGTLDLRFLPYEEAEARMVKDVHGDEYFEGYGIVFNKRSQMLGGWFVEIIKPEAVANVMDATDMRVDAHHITHQILGRKKAATASFEVDSVGVKYRAKNIGTTYAEDVAKNIRAGNIDGSSFQFMVAPNGDTWELITENGVEFYLRTITNFEAVPAMGPVINPAYLDTSAGLAAAKRSLDEWQARNMDKNLKTLDVPKAEGIVKPPAPPGHDPKVLELLFG
jgi:uncharacterized protein